MEKHIPKTLEFQRGKPHHFSFSFLNFINLIYKQDLDTHKIPFNRWDEYPSFWKFYLKPEQFDMSQFDAKWLLATTFEAVHKKLRSFSTVRESLTNFLKEQYHEDLAKLYAKYYIA